MKSYLLNALITIFIVSVACFFLKSPPLKNKTVNNKDILADSFADFYNIVSYDIMIPKEYTNGYRIDFFLKINDKIIPLGDDFSFAYGRRNTPLKHKLIFVDGGFSEISIGNVKNKLDLTKYIPNYEGVRSLPEFKNNIVPPKKCFIKYYKNSILSDNFDKEVAGIYFELNPL